MSGVRLARDYDPGEVFADQPLGARFSADLVHLLEGVRAPAATSDWEAWLREVEAVFGPTLTRLVFPLDGPVAVPDVPQANRQRCRTWARRWIEAATTAPLPWSAARMAVARLYLLLLAAGVWGADEGWRADLRDLVLALVPTDAEDQESPGQVMTHQTSVIAVCLALLLQDASPHGGGRHDAIAKTAWDTAGEWAAFAEPEVVARYLHVSDQAYARVATEAEVAAVIDLAMAAADDPHAELRDAFEREGVPATLVDGVWVVDGEFRNPRRVAAQVATMAAPACVVLARNATKAALVLRDGPTVVIAESTAPRWRIYRLTPLSTPLSLLGGDDGLPSSGTQHPLSPVPQPIRDLAEAAGVDLLMLMAAIRIASPTVRGTR
ncbi:hypothetical protein [Umezawaea sp. NPDC059074]|uniref:hypothetical protein n=1 Tax=Umezawaea sp. NPDC059074 TaxID=3346716 RepID=UPI0036C6C896